MIDVITECKNCRHNMVCKYVEEWDKQINELNKNNDNSNLVVTNVMIMTIECRSYNPITCTVKNIESKNTLPSHCNTYDGWGF